VSVLGTDAGRWRPDSALYSRRNPFGGERHDVRTGLQHEGFDRAILRRYTSSCCLSSHGVGDLWQMHTRPRSLDIYVGDAGVRAPGSIRAASCGCAEGVHRASEIPGMTSLNSLLPASSVVDGTNMAVQGLLLSSPIVFGTLEDRAPVRLSAGQSVVVPAAVV